MVYRYNIDVIKTKKEYNYFIYSIGILDVLFTISLYYIVTSQKLETGYLPVLISIFLSTISLSISLIMWIDTEKKRILDKLKESKIQQIKDSIDMFYVPLQNLLISYNENVRCKTKERIMIEVKSHKHLAEPAGPAKPSVSSLLEVYLKGNEESKLVSEELEKLVLRDMEYLQKSYIIIRDQIKEYEVTRTEN